MVLISRSKHKWHVPLAKHSIISEYGQCLYLCCYSTTYNALIKIRRVNFFCRCADFVLNCFLIVVVCLYAKTHWFVCSALDLVLLDFPLNWSWIACEKRQMHRRLACLEQRTLKICSIYSKWTFSLRIAEPMMISNRIHPNAAWPKSSWNFSPISSNMGN